MAESTIAAVDDADALITAVERLDADMWRRRTSGSLALALAIGSEHAIWADLICSDDRPHDA